MNKLKRYLLPNGVEEVLPAQAMQLETHRRRLLEAYQSWGYELVMPPFIEHLDTLVIPDHDDLDQQIFKIIDQTTGRLLGIRADMTPQVARIRAHQLQDSPLVRLCYMGTTLQTRATGFNHSRAPFQVGAELYGYAGTAADTEILQLMLMTLNLSGIHNPHIDLGHVEIFRSLAKQAGLNDDQECNLFEAMQRKASAEIEAQLSALSMDNKVKDMLAQLMYLQGDASLIAQARQVLQHANAPVHQALDELDNIISNMDEAIHLDLSELQGYSYHTGVVFAAYLPGHGEAIARGGRYDNICQVFDKQDPATGFSTDLKNLITFGQQTPDKPSAIFAPHLDNLAQRQSLQAEVKRLRSEGKRVICELPAQQVDAKTLGCDQQLLWQNQGWQCQTLN